MRNVADTGLHILYQMLQNIYGQPDAAQPFFKVEFPVQAFAFPEL